MRESEGERESDGQSEGEVTRGRDKEWKRERETGSSGMLSAVHVIHFHYCKVHYLTRLWSLELSVSVCVCLCVDG